MNVDEEEDIRLVGLYTENGDGVVNLSPSSSFSLHVPITYGSQLYLMQSVFTRFSLVQTA